MKEMNTLRRPLHPMPDFVRKALVERGLMDAYLNRPPYQRNDYIGWIIRAKQEKTQQLYRGLRSYTSRQMDEINWVFK